MEASLFEDLINRKRFLNGIKKLKDSGVSIYIDDRASDEKDWPQLLRESADAYFYMGDFIEDPETGELVSVRFDRVKHESI